MLFVVKTCMYKCAIVSDYSGNIKRISKKFKDKNQSHLNIDLKRVFISSSLSCHIVAHKYINGIILTWQSFLVCKKWCMHNNLIVERKRNLKFEYVTFRVFLSFFFQKIIHLLWVIVFQMVNVFSLLCLIHLF